VRDHDGERFTIAHGFAAILDCYRQLDGRLPQHVIFEEQPGRKRRRRRARIGVDRHLGGIEIEADDPTANAGALPLAIFMAGANEGEFAPQRSQCRRRQIIDDCLPLVANAFFVDEQQMTWCTEAEFDLVVGDGLDDLDSDALPCAGAATDHTSRTDLERGAIYVADLGIRERPGSAVGRLPTVFQAALAPQELYPCSKPRIVEGAGVNFVEVDTPCSIGSQRVGQHGVAPLLSGPASPCPRLRLSQ
jgi:hypothetical protein